MSNFPSSYVGQPSFTVNLSSLGGSQNPTLGWNSSVNTTPSLFVSSPSLLGSASRVSDFASGSLVLQGLTYTPPITSSTSSAQRIVSPSVESLTFSPQVSSPPPLTKKEIYKQIADIVCQVETGLGKASGLRCVDNIIAVPCHVLVWDQVDGGHRPRPILCTYKGVSYEAVAFRANNSAVNLDCALFSISDPDYPQQAGLTCFKKEIEAGEEVYFGGFPLTQESPTFHSGTISSVNIDNSICSFTIDGTVVPGNSGGPVFIVREGKLVIAGVIFHQIADFSPEDRETIALLNAIKAKQNKSGINRNFSYDTPQGRVTRSINDFDATVLALNLIQRNLSTGIGRAFHAMHLGELLNGEEIPPSSLTQRSMPVIRQDQMVKIHQGKNGKTYYLHCDGHQGKHVKFSRAKSKKDIQKYSERNPSTFYAEVAQNYAQHLQTAILGWVQAGTPEPSYFKFDFPIGADEGHETCWVEIYYGDKIGSHMRPKRVLERIA